MDQQKIGSFLKILRKEKELTQEQAAEKLGVSNRTISRWESGTYMPDISMLVSIAEMYDVDVREIIDGERKKENMNSEVKEVAEKMADYSNMEKKIILKWVKLMSAAIFTLSLCILILSGVRAVIMFKYFSASEMLKPIISNFFSISTILAFILLAFSVAFILYSTGKIRYLEQNRVAVLVVKILIVLTIVLAVFALVMSCFSTGMMVSSIRL